MRYSKAGRRNPFGRVEAAVERRAPKAPDANFRREVEAAELDAIFRPERDCPSAIYCTYIPTVSLLSLAPPGGSRRKFFWSCRRQGLDAPAHLMRKQKLQSVGRRVGPACPLHSPGRTFGCSCFSRARGFVRQPEAGMLSFGSSRNSTARRHRGVRMQRCAEAPCVAEHPAGSLCMAREGSCAPMRLGASDWLMRRITCGEFCDAPAGEKPTLLDLTETPSHAARRTDGRRQCLR